MTKLAQFAAYVTEARTASFTALDAAGRLEAVRKFYKDNAVDVPGNITITATKRGGYLTKDEKISIQSAYISALISGNVTPELVGNLEAVNNPEAVATFTTTLPYVEAVREFGPAVVAAKMIDALPVALNDEFHKIRKFNVPASVAISEIPAFIAELAQIYANEVGEVIAIDADGVHTIPVE